MASKTIQRCCWSRTYYRYTQKAFEKNRIAQAFLFAGPRGVGKTTTARLVAMSLNGADTPIQTMI